MNIRRVVLAILAAGAFCAYARVAAAEVDPCGGTGGNGQVVAIGAHGFTLKPNDKTGDQIVHLSPKVTFERSSRSASLSDLKVGDSVTLVGDGNPDGSFTADTVVLCDAGAEAADPKRDAHDTTRAATGSRSAYNTVRRDIDLTTVLGSVLTWCGIVALLRRKKKVGSVYLMFFSVYFVYAYKVLDYTLLRLQTLLLLQHFVPRLMINGIPAGRTVNFVPFVTLRLRDVKTSLLNVVMMGPFGFGLPFISDLRFKGVVIAGLLSSLTIELLQLITGFAAKTTFRIADVNDVIFNTLGVMIGYALFGVCVRILRSARHNRAVSRNPILRYVAQRPQLDASS